MTTRTGAVYETNRSLANSLDSTDGSRDGLRGSVGADDHRSLVRLGRILGLGNRKAVKDWMNTKAFRPAFERLYKCWIEVQQDSATASGKTRKRGPDLRAVVEAIDDPHAVAEERYTSPTGVDMSDFNEIDHYALCLVALRSSNTMGADGLFRGKTCSQEEIDQRLWQVILRAASDKTIERRKQAKKSTHEIRYGEKPAETSKSGQKRGASPSGHRRSSSKRGASPIEDDMSEDEPQDQNLPPANESLETPAGASLSSEDIAANDELLIKRNFERLKATQNLNFPLDLATDYGRYLTVHTTLEFFHQPLEIQRQVANEVLTIGEAGNQEALSEESRMWLDELESTIEDNRVQMRTVTSDDTDRVSKMEQLLDNAVYQRMDYKAACEALGITDPNKPHLPGMPATAILKSWQVTGVKALVDFEADPQLSACILADATGLGKTIELLAFWVSVSVI